MGDRREYFSVTELALIAKDHGLGCFPKSRMGATKFAQREGWNALPVSMVRERSGRGGGLEYHVSLLPKPMRAAMGCLGFDDEPAPAQSPEAAPVAPTSNFYTAKEIARIVKAAGVTNFPTTQRRVHEHAVRSGWQGLPSDLCRKREGKGGGMEYHLSLLPEAVQSVIRSKETATALLAAQALEVQTDRQQLALRGSMDLQARQRMVMERRSQVVLAIDRYRIAQSTTLAIAIRAFVAAQDAYAARQQAEQMRDAGEPIRGRELALLAELPLLTQEAGFGLTQDVLALANDRDNGSSRISRSTAYRWFQLRKEGGVAALAPARTKEEAPLPEGFAAFLKHYATPSKKDMTAALEAYGETDIGRRHPLTIAQVRYTLKVKLNDIERNVGREGLRTLRNRLPYIGRTTDSLLPTSVYVADGKTFDAEVADPRSNRPMKPEITTVMDVKTRVVVGYAISRKENTVAVVEALRNSCVQHGIPAMFYTDRGAGYKNKAIDGDKAVDGDVAGLMGRLSITKMHALPYNSQAKGNIERLNKTIWNAAAKTLPTYLGKDMDKEASAKVHKLTRSEIDKFGQSRLLPTWEDFRALCDEVIARYNARPHSSLRKIADPETGKMRHMSPLEAWDQHVSEGFEPIPVDEELRDDLFRPYVIRTVRRALVEWNTNTYFNDLLVGYHGEKVMVGYDDNDAERVWVREFDPNIDEPGKLICVATFSGNKQAYVPLTAQRAAEKRRAKGRLRLVERKVRDINEELHGNGLLPHMQPAPFVDVPATPELVPAEPSEPQPLETDATSEVLPTHGPRRRIFRSDEELAMWAMQNPEEVTENQKRLLEDVMQSGTAQTQFRMAGIDMEAFAAFLRDARANQKNSG
ncbi:MAG: DNA-binding protein [Pseudomonadota bacterium]